MEKNNLNGSLKSLKGSILKWMESRSLSTCKLEIDANANRKDVIIRSLKVIEEEGKIIRISEVVED